MTAAPDAILRRKSGRYPGQAVGDALALADASGSGVPISAAIGSVDGVGDGVGLGDGTGVTYPGVGHGLGEGVGQLDGVGVGEGASVGLANRSAIGSLEGVGEGVGLAVGTGVATFEDAHGLGQLSGVDDGLELGEGDGDGDGLDESEGPSRSETGSLVALAPGEPEGAVLGDPPGLPAAAGEAQEAASTAARPKSATPIASTAKNTGPIARSAGLLVISSTFPLVAGRIPQDHTGKRFLLPDGSPTRLQSGPPLADEAPMTGDRASTPGVTSAHLETRLVRSHVAEIAVRGELDMRTGAHLQEALERCFDDDSIEMLSLNLGGVTFIDSSGLRLLIRARRAAKMTDRVLVLTAPTESVVRLLEVTGMDKLFNIADD